MAILTTYLVMNLSALWLAQRPISLRVKIGLINQCWLLTKCDVHIILWSKSLQLHCTFILERLTSSYSPSLLPSDFQGTFKDSLSWIYIFVTNCFIYFISYVSFCFMFCVVQRGSCVVCFIITFIFIITRVIINTSHSGNIDSAS